MLIKQFLIVVFIGYVYAESQFIQDIVPAPQTVQSQTKIFKDQLEVLKKCGSDCKSYGTVSGTNLPSFQKCLQGCNFYVHSRNLDECKKNCIGNNDCGFGCGFGVKNEASTKLVDVKPAAIETGPSSSSVDIELVDPLNSAVPIVKNIVAESGEEDDNSSSSEEEETAARQFDLTNWFKNSPSSNILFKGEPQQIDIVQPLGGGGLEGELASIPSQLFNVMQSDNIADWLNNAIGPFFQKAKSLIGNGHGMIYTEEQLPNGQIRTNLQQLDREGNVISTSQGDTPLLGNIDNVPINWKGIPLSINTPIEQQVEHEDMNHHYRVCMPIQFTFKTSCRDINNIFNCASIRSGLPRWALMLLVLLISFSMIWMGIFMLSMAKRMKKRVVYRQQDDDYLPLYKDIDFSVETKLEVAAGPLPQKQPLSSPPSQNI